MEHDQRSFSRTATYIRAMLRRLPGPDAPQLFKETIPLGQDSEENPFADGRLSEAVATFLLALDRKVDSMLGLLTHSRLEADFPIPAHVVEIGGAGVRLLCEEELQVGDEVEVVLLLRQLPPSMAGAVGRVVRREEPDANGATDGRQQYALDFIRIRERDLDTVVQFVFNEERAHIREKKWD